MSLNPKIWMVPGQDLLKLFYASKSSEKNMFEFLSFFLKKIKINGVMILKLFKNLFYTQHYRGTSPCQLMYRFPPLFKYSGDSTAQLDRGSFSLSPLGP